MWESRVLRRAFERLELHEGKLSRAVLRGGGGGDVTSLPDTWVGNHPGLPGPRTPWVRARLEVDQDRCLTGTGGRGDHVTHVLHAVDGLLQRNQDRIDQNVGTGTG